MCIACYASAVCNLVLVQACVEVVYLLTGKRNNNELIS